ncbi:MAG: HD-GYP domain-containing protein [Candidatus Nitrospinota bacterium M3_3B_026]
MIKKIRTSDVRVGMFVEKVDSDWLTSPWIMSRFRIDSEKDIAKLKEYDIQSVFIDTEKGPDVSSGREQEWPGGERAVGLGVEETFEAPLSAFWVDRPVPVDIYRKSGASVELILKKGLAYSEEAEDLFRGSGVSSVHVPKAQKELFDRYQASLEAEREEQKRKGYDGLFTDPVRANEYLRIKRDYFSIDPIALAAGDRFRFDIYIRHETGTPLALARGERLEGGKRAWWMTKGLETAIRNTDRKAYLAYITARSDREKDEGARVAIVRENSRALVANLAKNPRSKRLLRKARQTVTDVTDLVIRNSETFYGLLKLRDYDYDTYTHSVNVAALTTALAHADGVKDTKELRELGLGAMLHDIGKSRVPHGIINKPGKLTPEEYTAAKDHVVLGYEMLKDNPAIPDLAFIPLLQHHEKLTGAGYPYGLSGGQVHHFGRIAALIDIYDALTTKRAYKKPLKPFDALALISKAIDDYDKALYRLFVSLMSAQRT